MNSQGCKFERFKRFSIQALANEYMHPERAIKA